jgi:hypothetical protein
MEAICGNWGARWFAGNFLGIRLLRNETLIVRRRRGNHLFYALQQRHLVDLILNALTDAAGRDGALAEHSVKGEN